MRIPAARFASRRTALVDAAAVVLVVVLAQLDAWTDVLDTELRGPAWLGCLVLTATGLLLVLRRRRPFLMVTVMSGLIVAWWAVEGTPPIAGATTIGLLIAAYSLGRWEPDRSRALAGAALIGAVLLVHILRQPGVSWAMARAELPWDLLLVGMWLLGAYLRYRSLYVLGLRDAAVQAERARIARELHDVVAHGVSVMVIQAEAGEELLSHHDPARASTALRNVQATGRQTLSDLRATLGALRAGADAEWAPQPGLTHIEDLADQVRAAGVEVTLLIRGEARALSPTVSLVAYRIVQEALTNTLKHSTAPTAQISLTYRPQDLTVEVVDEGPARLPTLGSDGAGLLGMRERVATVGGHVDTGPGPHGGYAVRARLPIPEPA